MRHSCPPSRREDDRRRPRDRSCSARPAGTRRPLWPTTPPATRGRLDPRARLGWAAQPPARRPAGGDGLCEEPPLLADAARRKTALAGGAVNGVAVHAEPGGDLVDREDLLIGLRAHRRQTAAPAAGVASARSTQRVRDLQWTVQWPGPAQAVTGSRLTTSRSPRASPTRSSVAIEARCWPLSRR